MSCPEKLPELLAPAGNFQCFETAVRFGADAVYLGGREFGMRASPDNFDFDDLKKAVSIAHEKNVRVYLTVNTTPLCDEIDALPQFLQNAGACGIDALIIGDLGVLSLAKKVLPDTPVHMSTQAGIVNHLSATELWKMGVSRAVLARELTLEDIKKIRDRTPPELSLEAFVHGAMCVSFSGRCLLSSYLTGRDANRGQCAQPCRWNYSLMEEKRPGQYYPVFEDEGGTYILNAKDLCMIEHIDKLAKAGIDSFKIEGRAKTFYYVGGVVNAYRTAIDLYDQNPDNYHCPDWLKEEVEKVSHRGYSTGFYFGRPDNSQYYSEGYIRNFDVVCTVDDWRDGVAYCTQRGKFCVGDTVEILEPGKRPYPLTIDWLKDESGQMIPSVPHPMMKLFFPSTASIATGSIVRKENV